MKHTLLSAAIVVTGVLTMGWQPTEYPPPLDLTGKKVVVRVYNVPDPGGPGYVTTKGIIEGRTINFDFKDANDATTFVVAARDQSDRALTEFFGERHHKWAYAEGPPYYLPISQAELEAKLVLVRVYETGKYNPDLYSKATLPVKQGKIKFEFDGIGESAFVAIFGQDQKDDVIKTVLGNRIYGWSYEKGLYLPMPQKVTAGQPPEPYWTFLDALGNPVAQAKVEIYLKGRSSQILLGKEMLDEQARLEKTLCRGDSIAYTDSSQPPARFSFKVSHPLYGTAIVQPRGGDHARLVFLPAVPPGTEADRRSIWGVVVDPNGRAVKAAFVKGGGLLPPGAKWVGDIRTQRHGVLTDESGRFRMYLPPAEDAIQVGALIPPNTQYSIRIEPPEGSNLSDFTGRVINGRSTTITLKRKQLYYRTFAFEDEGGPITDTQSLRGIDITIERTDQSNLYLHYDEFKNGGRYPLGTYKARSGPNKSYRFQPIKVTADSPEELVFRTAPAKTYYGRIVNGVTGQPMAGAFVIASAGYAERKNLSYLTAEQWDALHALNAAEPASDPNIKEALRPVNDCYSVIKIVRADPDGRFRLTEPPRVTVRDIVVFEEGHLTINVPKRWAKPDDEGNHRFGDIRLFPAAMVLVEPVDAQGIYRRWPLRFRPQWFLAAKKNPAWVQDLLAACEKHPENGIRREFWLEADQQHCFQVPAGLNLRIHLRVMDNIEWAQITIAEDLRLEPGEVFDAGRVEIGPPFKVFVKVLNSQGGPVEAIPVVVCGQHDPVISSSDEEGVAIFDFVGPCKGEFIVEYEPENYPDAPRLREAIPFEVRGPQDANTVYTIQLSDRILEKLLKQASLDYD